MKTIIFVFMISLLSINFAYSATATGWTFTKVKNGQGTRQWNNDIQMPCPLNFKQDCKVTIRSNSNLEVESVLYGFIIKVTIEDIEYQNMITNEVIEGDVPGSIIYDGEFELRIDSSAEYPELNGVTVDIPNTIINNNGIIHLFVPSN